MTVKVLNPRGIIIMGHSSERIQKKFGMDKIDEAIELVRRQYAHIIDVITYPDLKRRLKNTLYALKKESSKE